MVWSPPINLQKMLPSEPSKAALDCLLCLQLQSQLRISPVSSVNILDLFQRELNTTPVIQLGQLLPPGHTLKQTCYVCVCFRLRVSRKSGGIWEKDFLPLHSEFFVSSTNAIKIGTTTVNDNLVSSLLGIQQL